MSQSQQRKSPANPAKTTIFNSTAVAARLRKLKAAAVAAGKEDTAWWKGAINIVWAEARSGNNGTKWCSLNYTDEDGVTGRLAIRINGERHTGQIMPSTDAGVSELAARTKNPNVKVEKRTKKPAIQIQKWAAQVKTAEDGITVLKGADGQPAYPGDDKLSPYYQVAQLVGEAFAFEAKERIDRGAALVAKVAEMKKANKAATAQAILEAFNAAQDTPRQPGDMIVTQDAIVTGIRKFFPDQKDVDLLTKGATVTSNVKITSLVQEYISAQAKKNAGMPMPNPMTRIAMNFDQTTGVSQMAFFDKSKPYLENGKQKYEIAKVDEDPINADNVHKFILSRSGLDGIVYADSVCFSNMGISMPVKAEVLVVTMPSGAQVGIDDVFDDDGNNVVPTSAPEGNAPGGETPSEALAAAAAAASASTSASTSTTSTKAKAAPAAAPKATVAPTAEDFNALLGGLGATTS